MTTFIEKGVIRPPNPDAPNEIIRMMPRGVRDALISDQTIEEWPATIRDWCARHDLIHESTRRGYTGRLTRTQLGDRVARQLNQRMKGYV